MQFTVYVLFSMLRFRKFCILRFCCLLIFFKIFLFRKKLSITIRVSTSLDQDQARCFAGPDLGPNCLQSYQQTTQAGEQLLVIFVILLLSEFYGQTHLEAAFIDVILDTLVDMGDKAIPYLLEKDATKKVMNTFEPRHVISNNVAF